MKRFGILVLLGLPMGFLTGVLVELFIIDNHELLLKYLQVLLSWPPLITFIIFYVLISHREGLIGFIKGIKKIASPWGAIETEYQELEKTSIEQEKKIIPLASNAKEMASADEPAKKIEPIDKALNDFLKISLISNRHLIKRLLGRLWKKVHYGLITGIGLPLPPKFDDRVDGLRPYLDSQAVDALRYLEEVYVKQKEKTRSEILVALSKSVQLREYLENITA